MKISATHVLACALAAIAIGGCQSSEPEAIDVQSFALHMRQMDTGALEKVFIGSDEPPSDEDLFQLGVYTCERFETYGTADYHTTYVERPNYLWGLTREEQLAYYPSLMRGASAWICPEYDDEVAILLND